MGNVNDTFFDGYYKEIWKTVIPAELTIKEVDFMIPHFGLQPGSKVLDLMCGYGRHAIALAQKGIHVTAIDNLGDYTEEIQKTTAQEQLPITVQQASVTAYTTNEIFDLALCMGNSLNFFNAADTKKILSALSSHVRKGGHLLINSWSIAEIVFKNFKDNSWSVVGDKKFLTSSKLLFQPARIETESTIIANDGTVETKMGIDYIYSLNEMELMLKEAGLQLKEIYSIPGKKKFTLGEPRIYMVAEKS
jgi:cyclopropane fatty-acyl-phospholipid synthase-like methyltransferase